MAEAKTQTTEERWIEEISPHLVGRKITAIRYLSDDEKHELNWMRGAVVIELDDGNSIWPSADDEGNDAGALFTTFEPLPTIPVI